ncbi:MAG: hypothetical protein EOP53_00780 [Sphingobacteriales bacterium]|nr:MAG: hypothetical protein EOP53_00780 [Sphingobacteriales bacterium]
MKRCFLLFLALLFFANTQAQENKSPQGKLIIKFAPLALFDPNRSVIQSGLEYKPLQWLGLQLDYGLKFTPLQALAWTNGRENFRYYTLRAETRFYIYNLDETNFYLATEAFYLPHKYRLYDQFVERNGVEYRYDYADIEMKIIGGAIKTGFVVPVISKLNVDLYFGFGLRQRNIKHKTHEEVALQQPKFYEFFEPIELHEGAKTVPHISLGVKISYVLL